jgi:F-type H+-transporting ATPase subunit b
MDSLNLPSILTPDLGLLFWMLVAFLVVFCLLSKFGFPVITSMVEERKQYIDDSLKKARETHERMAQIQVESERMLKETHAQQAQILQQAKETGERIIQDARQKAMLENAKLLEEAKNQIQAEKANALKEINSIVANLSIEISEKILRNQLSEVESQQSYIQKLLDEVQVPKS